MDDYNPMSKEEAMALCRELGIDPQKFWGVVNNFACDCYYAGQQSVRKELAGGACENHAPKSTD